MSDRSASNQNIQRDEATVEMNRAIQPDDYRDKKVHLDDIYVLRDDRGHQNRHDHGEEQDNEQSSDGPNAGSISIGSTDTGE